MRSRFASKAVLLLVLAGFIATPTLFAEDEVFYCEVLSVEGTVLLNNSEVYGKALQEGDLLKVGDEVETAPNATADLALDKDWANVTRVEEKTRVKLKAVFPTRLFIDTGALYAKLKSLPRDSVFQVETPTAIAAVRGTEYRTEYADGETSVSNDSEADTSQIFIYEPDDAGERRGEPTILPRTQFTGIAAGSKPRLPKPMTSTQLQHCQKARGVLDNKIRENVARGRIGKIQDLHKMESFGQKMKAQEMARQEKEERRRDDRRQGQQLNDDNRAVGPNDPPGGSGSIQAERNRGSAIRSFESGRQQGQGGSHEMHGQPTTRSNFAHEKGRGGAQTPSHGQRQQPNKPRPNASKSGPQKPR